MKEAKSKLPTYLTIAWLVGVLFLLIYLVFYLRTESALCLENPAAYTAQQFEEKNAPLTCMCTVEGGHGSLTLNSSGLSQNELYP